MDRELTREEKTELMKICYDFIAHIKKCPECLTTIHVMSKSMKITPAELVAELVAKAYFYREQKDGLWL